MKRSQKIFLTLTFITAYILLGIALIEPMMAYGQSGGLLREGGRDPFLLPSGIHLLSKGDLTSVTKEKATSPEIKSLEKVKAILISDRIRLASIDQYIVTVGDTINDERVLEIKPDRVILGKGDKKRTLLLSQSPVQLKVEER